jgi:hypothetical protein
MVAIPNAHVAKIIERKHSKGTDISLVPSPIKDIVCFIPWHACFVILNFVLQWRDMAKIGAEFAHLAESRLFFNIARGSFQYIGFGQLEFGNTVLIRYFPRARWSIYPSYSMPVHRAHC